MLESIKYFTVCAWYIFLIVPLMFATIVTTLIGIAAIEAICCYWIAPCINTYRIDKAATKKKLEEFK